MAKPGTRVVVKGSNLFQLPLLDTDEARVVEFYDCHGDLVALFGKIFSDDFWAFSTKNDDDWNEVLMRNGYMGRTKYQGDPVVVRG
jgi:hypothetical protein